MLLSCFPHITNYRHVCRVPHTSCYSVLLAQRKQFIRVNHMPYIAHTFIWLPVSVVLHHHKQFIRVNCMSYIAHAIIWLLISFVLPHCKQFIGPNRMRHIAHTTKIGIVFDVSAIANVLHLFYSFFTSPFAINTSHTVSSKGL